VTWPRRVRPVSAHSCYVHQAEGVPAIAGVSVEDELGAHRAVRCAPLVPAPTSGEDPTRRPIRALIGHAVSGRTSGSEPGRGEHRNASRSTSVRRTSSGPTLKTHPPPDRAVSTDGGPLPVLQGERSRGGAVPEDLGVRSTISSHGDAGPAAPHSCAHRRTQNGIRRRRAPDHLLCYREELGIRLGADVHEHQFGPAEPCSSIAASLRPVAAEPGRFDDVDLDHHEHVEHDSSTSSSTERRRRRPRRRARRRRARPPCHVRPWGDDLLHVSNGARARVPRRSTAPAPPFCSSKQAECPRTASTAWAGPGNCATAPVYRLRTQQPCDSEQPG
jgi:hypothetical protein